MSKITDALYERFKENLAGASGDCVRTASGGAAQVIADLYREKGIETACVYETPWVKELGIVPALTEAGVTVHTDHIRLHAETDRGGISEVDYGIAELGTLVQASEAVDGRIVSTMAEDYIGILRGSQIVPEYDDMFDLLSALPEIPNFVGFVTGPSRTADIECVTTIGVHGPLRLTAVVVDDL